MASGSVSTNGAAAGDSEDHDATTPATGTGTSTGAGTWIVEGQELPFDKAEAHMLKEMEYETLPTSSPT